MLFVDEMDQKLRNDRRADAIKISHAKCLEVINDGLRQIEVEAARINGQ
ncbi:hypothetical protein [Mesorhizobium sp. WSM3876]|nr:hypothetical protein [Mesorhizobium sp. WSM3876]